MKSTYYIGLEKRCRLSYQWNCTYIFLHNRILQAKIKETWNEYICKQLVFKFQIIQTKYRMNILLLLPYTQLEFNQKSLSWNEMLFCAPYNKSLDVIFH